MVQTRRRSFIRNVEDNIDPRTDSNDPATDSDSATVSTMAETTMLITYAVGTTQYYSLLLSDIYDVTKDVLDINVIDSIVAPLHIYQSKIFEGWTVSQVDALKEATSRGDDVISLRRKDGIEIRLGSTQEQLEAAKRQIKIVAMSINEI
jgi:hypothetical protein